MDFESCELAEGIADLRAPYRSLSRTVNGRQMLVDSGRMTVQAAERIAEERKRNRRARDRRNTKWEAAHFIGWDGEGVNVNGRHRYVILASSAGDALVRPEGIRTAEAFDLLLSRASAEPLATHVIFAGSYDVNMMLRPCLARSQARLLADEGTVTVRDGGKRFRVRYHPRHEFGVREESWDDDAKELRKYRTMTLWDIFGSFQSSFVKACKRQLPDDELAELAEVERMKGLRSRFTLDDLPEMLTYCQQELRFLVRLAQCDRDNFAAAGFQTSRWDGAGAKASAVLHVKGIGAHKEVHDGRLSTPVRGAYSGGRIEQVRFGDYSGDLYTVDIRSAYPYAATFLPSLKGGTWERKRKGERPGSFDEYSLWHVRYESLANINQFHPFYWRAPDERIYYPFLTDGWYWAPEVFAALENCPQGAQVKLLGGWRFHPASDAKPFGFIPELFAKRKELDRAVKGRGWPLKLALNSLYGKMAQQVGGKDGNPPRWHQLDWAGWITSYTRATMYRLASVRQTDLISVQTDGLTFMGHPDKSLLSKCGDDIGSLEVEEYDGGTFVQSGIYWLHDSAGWHEPKVRGVGDLNPDTGKPYLFREDFTRAWETGDYLSTITVPVNRFRGLVTSCLTPQRWIDWCQWLTEPREIAVAPVGKREHAFDDCPACDGGAQLHSTWPTRGGGYSRLHTLEFERKVGGATRQDEWWLRDLSDDDSSEDE